MAEVTVADFKTRFPEFTQDDGHIQLALDEALMIHAINPLATMYCTAHLLTRSAEASKPGANGLEGRGEVASEGAGPFRIEYITQAESMGRGQGSRDAYFTSTTYGQSFLTLEKRTPRSAIGAMVAG